MKTIIFGSRSFVDAKFAFDLLDHLDFPVTEVVSGCANGADKIGEEWAKHRGIPVKQMPADWKAHGRSAGVIRNMAMGDYADAAVGFWQNESPGSKHMIEYAKKKGLRLVTIPC